MTGFRCIVLLLLLTSVNSSAQNAAGFFIFDAEADKILIAASKQKVKKVVMRLNTHRTDQSKGDKIKITATFINDSVFEQKSSFRKSLYVIRNGFIYPYDPEQKKLDASAILIPKDSAGCIVFWGTPSLRDSTDVSYCRITRDSLRRWIDYYFTVNNTVRHQTWHYEGDSAYWHDSWELHADTMRLLYSEYVYHYYNTDSSFYTTVTKRYHLPHEIIFPYNDVHQSEKTFITYDNGDRIIEVKKEVCNLTDGRASVGAETYIMKVKYVSR